MNEPAPPSEAASHTRANFVGCLILLAIACFIYLSVRPAMPRDLLRQVTPGMTKTEVRIVLGEPHSQHDDDYQWNYWRWGNAGWVEVHFNVDGTVRYVNDESVSRP